MDEWVYWCVGWFGLCLMAWSASIYERRRRARLTDAERNAEDTDNISW